MSNHAEDGKAACKGKKRYHQEGREKLECMGRMPGGMDVDLAQGGSKDPGVKPNSQNIPSSKREPHATPR